MIHGARRPEVSRRGVGDPACGAVASSGRSGVRNPDGFENKGEVPVRRPGAGRWPVGLSQAQREALDLLLKSPPRGEGGLHELLRTPGFKSLAEGDRAPILAGIADRAIRHEDVNGSIHATVTAARLAQSLPPPERTELLRVAGVMSNDGLDTLLFAHQRGALGWRDGAGTTVLTHLLEMSQMALAPGVNRQTLMGQVLKDICDPTRIFQGARSTCGATSASIALAQSSPGEYVRLLQGLAGVSGTVSLPNGQPIVRKDDALQDDSNRTLTGRLLQPALMEFADGSATYDNRTQKHTRGLPKNIPGLTQPEMLRLVNALFPRGGPYSLRGSDMSAIEVAKAITPGGRPHYPSTHRALNEGKVPGYALLDVDIDFRKRFDTHIPASGFHWVLVQEVKGGRVYFDDPNRVTREELASGRRSRPGDYRLEPDGRASMPLEDFKSVMWSYVSP